MEIEGYPNYLIYPDGRVFSKKRNKFMKPFKAKNGYLRAQLGNKQTPISIHRLVALNYIPNPDNLPIVHHKNGIRDDNRIENLEWCSAMYNTQSINTSHNIGCINKCSDRNKWMYSININGKRTQMRFDTEEEAECQRILMTSMLS